MKKICVITGNRADYGILRGLLKELVMSEEFDVKLIVTGSHLCSDYGYTINEILEDGFNIEKKIEILINSDSSIGISKSMGLALISFSEAFDEIRPDLILVLGDRFEIFSAAISAMNASIPIAHIHGGELSLGSIDDSIRHSITKISHIHFVSTDKYKSRVIQLGESEERVFSVGSLSLDKFKENYLFPKSEIEDYFKFKFKKNNLIVTFHPVTLENNEVEENLNQLFSALEFFQNIQFIFTMSNPDKNGKYIWDRIQTFCKENKNCIYIKSFGKKRYFSALHYVDGVIGNSSSGIIEVPSFSKGSINIGIRQEGRVQADSVINVECDSEAIKKGITKLYEKDFIRKLKTIRNPYEKKDTIKNIINVLKKIDPQNLNKKKFNDII